MAEKKFMQADDLFHISSISDPRFSPDGSEALFIRTEMDKEKNTYVSNLYLGIERQIQQVLGPMVKTECLVSSGHQMENNFYFYQQEMRKTKYS